MIAENSSDNRTQVGALHRWSRRVAILLATVFAVLLAQQFYGIGLTARLKIDPKSIKLFKDNKAYRYRLPDDYTTELVAAKGQVLENGLPLLNKRPQAHDVVGEGRGSYHFKPPHVRFSAPDDSDIRDNGRHYEILAPKQFDEEVFYWLTGLLLLSLGLAIRGSAMPLVAAAWHVPNLAMFIIALAVTVSHVFLHPDLSSGGLLVKGMPESDAGGWHHMALEIAQGLGITPQSDSQRPFYSIMLGAVYLVCGHTILVAKLFHAVILSLVATMVMSFATALRRHWTGVVAAGVLIWSEDHEYMMHSILTENAGLLFAVLGVAALWVCGFGSRDYSLFQASVSALVAGLLIAFGNLASGVMLMLVPVAPFMLVAMQLRWLQTNEADAMRRWLPSLDSLRRGLLIAAAFTFGVCTVFLPWMARQYSRYGVFTLSTNTGELLYGGADPVNGKLTGANFHLPEQAGLDPNDLGARMKFYMAKYKEQVALAPTAYFQQVGRAWMYVFHVSSLDSPALRTGVLLLLLGTGIAETLRRGSLIPAIVAVKMMVGWMYLTPAVTLPVLIVASALCLLTFRGRGERWLLACVIATLVCGTFLSAMAGAVGVGRFWTVIDWAMILLVCLGLYQAHNLLSRFGMALWKKFFGNSLMEANEASVAIPADVAPQWQKLARSMAVLSLLAIVLTTARAWLGPSVASPSFANAIAIKSSIAQWVVQQHPDTAVRGYGSQVQASLAIDNVRAGFFAANEDIGTFLADYQPREYSRWVVVPQLMNEQGISIGATPMQCRSSAPHWETVTQPALWIWVPGQGTNRILKKEELTHELLAVVPLRKSDDGKQWEANKSATRWVTGW